MLGGGGGLHGHRWLMFRIQKEIHRHDGLLAQFGAHDALRKNNTERCIPRSVPMRSHYSVLLSSDVAHLPSPRQKLLMHFEPLSSHNFNSSAIRAVAKQAFLDPSACAITTQFVFPHNGAHLLLARQKPPMQLAPLCSQNFRSPVAHTLAVGAFLAPCPFAVIACVYVTVFHGGWCSRAMPLGLANINRWVPVLL